MKKLAVLTAVVFLFGFAGFAAADDHGSQDPAVQANGADIVGGGGTNANDGGTAVAVKDTLNGNETLSNNTTDISKTVDVNKSAGAGQSAATTGGTALGLNESANGNSLLSGNTEDSNNTETVDVKKTEDSFNTKVEAEKGSQAANNGGSNISQEAFKIENEKEYHATGESVTTVGATTTTTTTVGAGSINGSNSTYVAAGANNQAAGAKYKSDNPEAEEGSQQVVGTGSNVKASAEDGSIAVNNAAAAVTLDKSTTITISDIGLAIQKTELEGKVEDNKLIVGGPKAVSVTKGGEGEAGKAESDDAKSGKAVSVAKSKSGSGAFAGASGGSDPKGHNGGFPTFGKDENEDSAAGATADADSDSKSKATGGSAATGAANSTATNNGIGTGGAATSEAVTAYTNFTTGNNNFTTGSFNGIGGFNVNSGVNSLNQSMINVNAVVGGGVAGQ